MNKPKGNEQSTSGMKEMAEKYVNQDGKEGPVAKTIEEQTAKLPSDLFLWAALGSMAVSASLKIAGRNHTALFVGQWAPSFLILGLYNKLVKLQGHDQKDQKPTR
jgi:hypothetical protein